MKKKYLFISLLLLITNAYTQTISPFILPLPEKYKNTSSCQELREIIEIEETGASTSGLWHNGLDFPCPDKTEVYAVKDGKVICVYPGYYNGEKFKGHPFYGGLIIIKHFDGTITLYAHLSCTFVAEGAYIKQGQKNSFIWRCKRKESIWHFYWASFTFCYIYGYKAMA